MNGETNTDFLLKIVIIGDTGVGKTNLLSRFARDTFDPSSRNTIGVDFFALDLQIDSKQVKVQFWDTAGQEKYRAISSAYYKNAHGAIIVYDVTSRASFSNVENWLNELREHGDKNIQILIIGNKNDLKDERQVLEEEGAQLAEKLGFFFTETSAKVNENSSVNKGFMVIIGEVLKYIQADEKALRSQIGFVKSAVEIDADKLNEPMPPPKKSCC